jgi:hypothetical protein
MKKNYKYILGMALMFIATGLFFQSCTKNFEDINTDPYGPVDSDLEADYVIIGEPFRQVQMNFYTFNPVWVFQLQQNLIGDVYSGYMMPPTPFAGNINNMTYALVNGWNGFPWSVAYENIMNPLAKVEKKAAGKFDNFVGWAKICRVEGMHRLSDIYGPLVYSQYGIPAADGSFPYDCQESLYDQFFKDLQEGIDYLTPYANDPAAPKAFTRFDLVYNGDYASWIRFANSLRLRLAMRISKVDPARAQAEAEKSINNPFGVLTSNDQNFMVNGKLDHPLNTINNAWNDIRMGAPMESILGGLQDPREAAYFQTSEIEDGTFKGIRSGLDIKAKADYQPFSKLGDLGLVQLMTCSEISFIRAEGALRGWNMGGTAQHFYEEGIRLSFEQHGLDASDYINNDVLTPMDYTDPVNADNNIAAATDLTVKWNDADDNERKLEKIITQKWIAMFPDGQEAWSEFRRTGYPKLFPNMVNYSGGTISTDEFIKRVNFVDSEYQANPAGVAGAVECLGGADNGGTNLWWDVDGGNF